METSKFVKLGKPIRVKQNKNLFRNGYEIPSNQVLICDIAYVREVNKILDKLLSGNITEIVYGYCDDILVKILENGDRLVKSNDVGLYLIQKVDGTLLLGDYEYNHTNFSKSDNEMVVTAFGYWKGTTRRTNYITHVIETI